jgi:mannose-6-phosphate isomerase-like protein (cupin superfamily)
MLLVSRRWVGFCCIVVLVVVSLFLIKLVRLGWLLPDQEHYVVPIKVPDKDGRLLLAEKDWMAQIWIHNIHVADGVPFHYHKIRPEMVAILRGKARVRGMRLNSDGGDPIIREEVLGPGNLVFSPPGQVHEYTNIGAETLWCLVVQSPQFRANPLFEEGMQPTKDDFLVIPWTTSASPRGEYAPVWAEYEGVPWRGAFNFFPGIQGHFLRGHESLEASDPESETWMVLLEGSGLLQVEGASYEINAPTFVYAPRDGWSLRGGGELVALELQLPSVDLNLFAKSFFEKNFEQ